MPEDDTLLTSDLWEKLAGLAKAARVRLAASAYVTSETVRFEEGDLLICDASEQQIRSGATKATVILAAHLRGARIHHFPGLHAKVLVLDDAAIVGSANLTANSQKLQECAVLTRDRRLVGQARTFIEQLRENSVLLDLAALRRLTKIPVPRRNSATIQAKPVPPLGRRAWIVGLNDLDEEDLSADEKETHEMGLKEAEETQLNGAPAAWFRLKGNNKCRTEAKAGDRVITIHSAKKGAKRYFIYRPITLLSVKHSKTATFFYYDESEESQTDRLTPARFSRLLVSLGSKLAVKPGMIRSLPGDLLNRLEAAWPE